MAVGQNKNMPQGDQHSRLKNELTFSSKNSLWLNGSNAADPSDDEATTAVDGTVVIVSTGGAPSTFIGSSEAPAEAEGVVALFAGASLSVNSAFFFFLAIGPGWGLTLIFSSNRRLTTFAQ
jgi:hypothetical protein